MEFIKSINTKNILKYLIFSGIVYSLIKIIPRNPLNYYEKTILLIVSITALIGLDLILSNHENFTEDKILSEDYNKPVLDIVSERSNENSKLLNLTKILQNSQNSNKLLSDMIKENLLNEKEIKILYQNNAITYQQLAYLINQGIINFDPFEKFSKQIIDQKPKEENQVEENQAEENQVEEVKPKEENQIEQVKPAMELTDKNMENDRLAKIKEREELLKMKEIEIAKKEMEAKLKAQEAELKRKEDELKRKEENLNKKEKTVINEMKYNELPEEFFKPIGEGLEKWGDDGSYSILNTDKWRVPMPRPPVCISSSKPCEPCPLATSGYPLNLKEWDTARKVSNVNINKDWVKDL